MWRGRGALGARGLGAGRHGNARGQSVLLLMMLLRKIQELDRKPPVTLALMATMCGLHFQKMLSPGQFKRFSLCPDKVVFKMELSRVVMSAFLHADDVHLYHNMISFLWKGYHLEHRFGWLRFVLIILYLLLLSHFLVVAVAFALDTSGALPGSFRQCSVGFSGVLFALKVLLNHGSPAFSSVYGFQVPTKYAAWLELVMIQLVVPRASFLGHVCGILAGYAFVLANSEKRLIDPLAHFMLTRWRDFSRPTTPRQAPPPPSASPRAETRHSYESDEVMARRLQEEKENERSDVHQRYAAYQHAQSQHTQQPHDPPTVRPDISQDELRRRRVARFNNS